MRQEIESGLSPDLQEKVLDADKIIRKAVIKHNPLFAFALFSGGHDSLTATHLSMRHPYVREVLHINTGIGIEATRSFVRQTCMEQGWPLAERHPPAMTYEEMVLTYGFPGPGGHLFPYSWLKKRTLEKAVAEHKAGHRRVLLITGVRQKESDRRMGHVAPIYRDHRMVWVAPLCNWTSFDVTAYIHWAGLKRNPVVDRMHMSGECLCGAFAKKGEMATLETWFPDVARQIHDLEKRAEAAGVPSKWGVRPARHHSDKRRVQKETPLCFDCTPGVTDE